MSRKTRLNVPRLLNPTSMQMSVTLLSLERSSHIARSTRRRCRYRFGVSPKVARKLRMKCASETWAIRASVGTSSGSAYERSMTSRARSSRRLFSSVTRLTPAIASDLDAALAQPRDGVDLLAVDAASVHLEVQVRAGGLAALTEQRDLLAGLHVVADLHEDLLHVAVDGDVAVLVEDVDGQAEAAGRAGLEHDAVHGRVFRGEHRGGKVDAPVHGPPAHAEAGGQAGAVDRQHGLGPGGLACGGLGLGSGRAGGGHLLQPRLGLRPGGRGP